MSIHDEILAAARRICVGRGEWTFSLAEIVGALPHLNARSVRTHVTSRCCINAPANHPHRLPYFLRVGRGTYEICPPFRHAPEVDSASGQREGHQVAESVAEYAASGSAERTSIHAVVFESEGQYVAECLEIAVVTQGRSLDETLANLREALALYLDGEDGNSIARLGLSTSPRLVLSLETSAL